MFIINPGLTRGLVGLYLVFAIYIPGSCFDNPGLTRGLVSLYLVWPEILSVCTWSVLWLYQGHVHRDEYCLTVGGFSTDITLLCYYYTWVLSFCWESSHKGWEWQSRRCSIHRVPHGYRKTHGFSKMGSMGTGTVVDFATPRHTAYPYHGITGM